MIILTHGCHYQPIQPAMPACTMGSRVAKSQPHSIKSSCGWDGMDPPNGAGKKNTKIPWIFHVISPVWGDFPVTFDYWMVINPQPFWDGFHRSISEKNGMGSNIEIST